MHSAQQILIWTLNLHSSANGSKRVLRLTWVLKELRNCFWKQEARRGQPRSWQQDRCQNPQVAFPSFHQRRWVRWKTTGRELSHLKFTCRHVVCRPPVGESPGGFIINAHFSELPQSQLIRAFEDELQKAALWIHCRLLFCTLKSLNHSLDENKSVRLACLHSFMVNFPLLLPSLSKPQFPHLSEENHKYYLPTVLLRGPHDSQTKMLRHTVSTW